MLRQSSAPLRRVPAREAESQCTIRSAPGRNTHSDKLGDFSVLYNALGAENDHQLPAGTRLHCAHLLQLSVQDFQPLPVVLRPE